MLTAKKRASEQIIQGIRQKNTLLLTSQAGTIQVTPVSERAVRIVCTKAGCEDTAGCENTEDTKESLSSESFAQWIFTEDDQFILLKLAKLTVKINKKTASISHYY